ncbi:Serine/threonine-protein kinase PknB [Gimesia aquarii]|uniref:non-specific serine/threonine protein kinase n=2 Tax=Gimesia aquarii TaxID=2527964 RepID=A0A517X013_9PLAN|nr:Serine/threonine-protein kinase PknB [Gimesia aquarii]
MIHPEENKIMSDPEKTENPEPEPTRENVNPQSVEGLFLQALEKKTPAERTQFLEEMCGDNMEQRRRVEALLLAYDDAGSFLEKSPIGSSEPQPVSLEFLTPSDNPELLGTLGEYDIYEVIGQGGMGIVFRALDPKLNRIVAIKVMSPLLAINPNARKRFLREAQAAAAVSHPHIVTIHAVDEDKLPYLVMEYVVGQSLQEKLDKVGSLKVTEILRIGNQIAEGLAAAHKQGLIHRDIKPANILLENGVERVKITDFGLARAVDDVTITKTGEVSGTPQYMSPEQTTGERVDQRSDLFSLGAVMYAMCTGRSPFRASNLAAVVRRVCDDTPRPIQEVNEEIPPWLIEIIDCLLEKRPEDRFQTAQEVAELLGTHLAIVQQPGKVPAIDERPREAHRQGTEARHTETESIKESDPRAFYPVAHAVMFLGGMVAFSEAHAPLSFPISAGCGVFLGLLIALVVYEAERRHAQPFAALRMSDALSMPIAFAGGTLLMQMLFYLEFLPSIPRPLLYLLFLLGIPLYFVWILSKQQGHADRDFHSNSNQRQGQWVDRLAVWAGGLMLLTPIFIGLFGIATGRHFAGNVPEMILVSLLFFGPVGLLVLVCGAQNIVRPNSTTAKILDGLFLLACFCLGPLGILLYIARYIKRRDAREQENSEPKPVSPHQDPITAEHKRSNKRIIVGVILGVITIPLLFLFALAFRHMNPTEKSWVVNWGLMTVVVCGMFGAMYYIKRKGVLDALSNPWKLIGWLVLSAMLLIPSLFAVSLLVPMLARTPGSNEVVINYDPDYPITKIMTETGKAYDVYSKPFTLKLTPGSHVLQISYNANNLIHRFTKKIKKEAGKQLKIDLSTEIKRLYDANVNQRASVDMDEAGEADMDGSMFSDDSKAVSAERKKNLGAILLSGQEPSLRAGIFPVNPFQAKPEDGVFGFADRFFTFESLTHEVPAGKYFIRVSSNYAGWEIDDGTPKYDLTEIEVKPGTIVPVTIQRDFTKLVESHPDWSKGGLFKFHWPVPGMGAYFMVYTLTLPQAEVVQELLAAFVAGKPSVHELELMETANKHIITKSYASMKNLFNNGKHPAWKKLIVSGEGENTWQLITPESELKNTRDNKPNNGTILLKIQDTGLRVSLLSTTDSSLTRKTDYGIYFPDLDMAFKVPAGMYLIEVTSDDAGWVADDSASKYLHSNIKVKPGVLDIVAISRDYQKLAENHPDWTQSDVFEFGWPLQVKSDWPIPSVSGPPKNYRLSRPQAKVVQQLFSAFAEGKPDVNEKIILETVNEDLKKETYKSLKELFDKGEHPAWGILIVPGKEKNTYRLREPK